MIYTKILKGGTKTTIICGGQSPAYYCLAMMNFKIYDPQKVNIFVLPHSKGGVVSLNQTNENISYCERLKEKNINPYPNVVIIDGVHSGTGILALESALMHCFQYINVKKIAINANKFIAKIPVDETYVLPCEPKFSDTFPRIVMNYRPDHFTDSGRFITELLMEPGNQIAEMIIDIAKIYPDISVENTDWFNLNNIITPEIETERKREMQEETQEKLRRKRVTQEETQEKSRMKIYSGTTFTPIVLTKPKRYKCPECNTISGTALIMTHNFSCSNKYKTPKE